MDERPSFDEFRYVDEPEHWTFAGPSLASARVVAVDTEADSMHSYFEKVCLVQVATDGGEAYVFDPLALADLEPLRAPLADPGVVTVFHGADFDVVSLRRDFGFRFAEIFDTMVASQLLGDEKLSLRDLVERFFGVVLEKAHTRTDWGRRPLSREQLLYSYLDVAYLVELAGIQQERLEEADLLDEARIEFDRLAEREPAPRGFDPHGWLRVKGSRDLAPQQQAVLHEVFAVRDRHARQLDRPAFKVLGNDPLLRIARHLPQTRDDLRAIRGLSSYVTGRMAQELLDAVRRGIDCGGPPPRPRTPSDPTRRMDPHAQKRLGRLRDWRNEASARFGVTTLAILPNYAMFDVARDRPRSPEELERIPGVGPRRVEKWGREILGLLR